MSARALAMLSPLGLKRERELSKQASFREHVLLHIVHSLSCCAIVLLIRCRRVNRGRRPHMTARTRLVQPQEGKSEKISLQKSLSIGVHAYSQWWYCAVVLGARRASRQSRSHQHRRVQYATYSTLHSAVLNFITIFGVAAEPQCGHGDGRELRRHVGCCDVHC